MGRRETQPYGVPRRERWALLNLRFKWRGWWHCNLRGQWLTTRGPIIREKAKPMIKRCVGLALLFLLCACEAKARLHIESRQGELPRSDSAPPAGRRLCVGPRPGMNFPC